jgi:hypothetical protein
MFRRQGDGGLAAITAEFGSWPLSYLVDCAWTKAGPLESELPGNRNGGGKAGAVIRPVPSTDEQPVVWPRGPERRRCVLFEANI